MDGRVADSNDENAIGTIVSAPDPPKKIPGPGNYEELTCYGNGFDVTAKNERRDWQHQFLNKLTRNG